MITTSKGIKYILLILKLSLKSSLDPITVEWDRWLHYDCISTGYLIPDQKDSVEFV